MPRVNRTRFVILGLLALGPRSGYDIRREVSEITGYFWNESYGQIYPMLGRLAGEGLVRRRTERVGGRLRHVYGLTPAGKRALADWLEAPVEAEVVRRELLLKVFFGRNATPGILIGHVEAFRERAKELGARVSEIEGQLLREPGAGRDLPYWLMTTRFGKEISKAHVGWCDAVLAELSKRIGGERGRHRVGTRSTSRSAGGPGRAGRRAR